jgi:hypothetical protein
VNTKKFFKEKAAYDKIYKDFAKSSPSKKNKKRSETKTNKEQKKEQRMKAKMNYIFEITPEQYKLEYVGTKKKDLIIPRIKKLPLSTMIETLDEESKAIKASMMDTKYKLYYELFDLALAEDKVTHLDSIQKKLDENEKKVNNLRKSMQIDNLKLNEHKKQLQSRKKDIISEIKGLGNDAPIAQKRELLKDYNNVCYELYELLSESKKQSFQEIDVNLAQNTKATKQKPVRESIPLDE